MPEAFHIAAEIRTCNVDELYEVVSGFSFQPELSGLREFSDETIIVVAVLERLSRREDYANDQVADVLEHLQSACTYLLSPHIPTICNLIADLPSSLAEHVADFLGYLLFRALSDDAVRMSYIVAHQERFRAAINRLHVLGSDEGMLDVLRGLYLREDFSEAEPRETVRSTVKEVLGDSFEHVEHLSQKAQLIED